MTCRERVLEALDNANKTNTYATLAYLLKTVPNASISIQQVIRELNHTGYIRIYEHPSFPGRPVYVIADGGRVLDGLEPQS